MIGNEVEKMKAALVLDEMPKSCDECDFIDSEYHYCNIPWFGKDVSDYVACRHEDCPLKHMQEHKEHHHTYENCHNITCRRKCEKDGYEMAIEEFAEIIKAESSYGLSSRIPAITSNDIDRIAESMKGEKE